MKKRLPALGILLAATLSSCGKTQTVDENSLIFSDADLIQSSFGGLGVEWGAYENVDKLDADSWKRIYENADLLSPQVVRLMVNYDWFIEEYDDKGDDDNDNDVWTYNFTNKWAENMTELLQYCQEHEIEVAFGAWNVVGSVALDEWAMFQNATSDPRWAKMCADVVDYLVNKQGFTCIHYLVNGNEPNYTGVQGASKNYANTVEKWMQGVRNVRAELDSRGLTQIKIVGGDTTGVSGTLDYFTNIATNISELVGDYGAHLYLSNYYIDNGLVQGEIDNVNAQIHAIDSGYGSTRPLHIWECGLLDGKNQETDSNSLIKTVGYGIRMADFTAQCLLAGVNSIAYWSFDDGMHFMYNSDGSTTSKKWGMFSSLSSDQSVDQERRPWFYSSCLLTHLFRRGSKIYRGDVSETFRSIATVNEEEGLAGALLINRSMDPIQKKVSITAAHTKGEKLYTYIFGEGYLRVDESGVILPNNIIEGDVGDAINVTVPANSIVIVSKEAL